MFEALLNLLIPAAHAQDAAAPAGGSAMAQLLPLVILIVLFYFMLIRPQMKRSKEHRKMTEALSVGDEIISTGGVAGEVTEVGDSYVRLEIAEDVVILLQKQAVSSVLPKGSLGK